METINIAGVNCRVDKLSTIKYDDLLNSALGAEVNRRKSKKEIEQILKDNGFKPVKIDTAKVELDNASIRGKSTKKRNSTKQRRNRNSGKE